MNPPANIQGRIYCRDGTEPRAATCEARIEPVHGTQPVASRRFKFGFGFCTGIGIGIGIGFGFGSCFIREQDNTSLTVQLRGVDGFSRGHAINKVDTLGDVCPLFWNPAARLDLSA